MSRLTKDQFFATAPTHLVEAVKEGKAAHFNGEMYTLESLGVDTALMPSAIVESEVALQAARAKIAELEAQIAAAPSGASAAKPEELETANKRVTALEAEAATTKETLVSIREALGLSDDGDVLKAVKDAAEGLQTKTTELETANKRVTALEAEAAKDPNAKAGQTALLEMLIPGTESALRNISEEKVNAIATYREIPTDGKSKDELIALLLKKGS